MSGGLLDELAVADGAIQYIFRWLGINSISLRFAGCCRPQFLH